MSYQGFKSLKSDTYTHAHTRTHTSGHQLKITFLNVLDYSEYSDTNIANKKQQICHATIILKNTNLLLARYTYNSIFYCYV